MLPQLRPLRDVFLIMRDHHERGVGVQIMMKKLVNSFVVFRVEELKGFVEQKQLAIVQEHIHEQHHLK